MNTIIRTTQKHPSIQFTNGNFENGTAARHPFFRKKIASDVKLIEQRDHLLLQGLEKFHHAADIAKIIGKGSIKIIEKGYTPLILLPEYIYEIKQRKKNPLNGVQYLTPRERSRWIITIENGKLYKNGKFYNTSENKAPFQSPFDAFVVSPDLQIYAGAIQWKKFHHSSFLAGGAVIFAGELETDATGKILTITNRSGHYKPQEECLLRMLELFKRWQMDLSQVRLIIYSSSKPNAICTYNSAEQYLRNRM